MWQDTSTFRNVGKVEEDEGKALEVLSLYKIYLNYISTKTL